MKLYPREWVALRFPVLKHHLPNTPTGLAEHTRACLARWAAMSAVPLDVSAERKSRGTHTSSLDATASAQDDSSTGVPIIKYFISQTLRASKLGFSFYSKPSAEMNNWKNFCWDKHQSWCRSVSESVQSCREIELFSSDVTVLMPLWRFHDLSYQTCLVKLHGRTSSGWAHQVVWLLDLPQPAQDVTKIYSVDVARVADAFGSTWITQWWKQTICPVPNSWPLLYALPCKLSLNKFSFIFRFLKTDNFLKLKWHSESK